MGDWSWVAAGYATTYVCLGAYAAALGRRARNAARRIVSPEP